MSKPIFGKLLDGNKLPTRDAIHVPIIPVRVGSYLYGGDPVNIKKIDGEFVAVLGSYEEDSIGVLDPFIGGGIEGGTYCYCFLKPNSVKKLWHEWTHKEIDGKEKE